MQYTLLTSAKIMAPLRTEYICQHLRLFLAGLGLEFLVGKQSKACLRHHENNGTRDHQNCYVNRTEVPIGIGTIGLWGF